MRKALAAGVALAFVASFVGDADAATRRSKRAQTIGKIAKKRDVPIKQPFGEMPKGPLQMVVSIGQQHVTLYANGVRVGQARVSTGTAANPTPTGVFSVIQKDRWHRSNLYNNAPMFYMQRLTWSGVAMHEGVLPGYPASHGCIRLPTDFASRLWVVTRLGVRVIVARNDPAPYEFNHPKLFNPRQKPVADQVADLGPIEELRRTIAASEFTTRPIVLAQATIANDDITDRSPDVPGLVTETPPPGPAVPPAEHAATSRLVEAIEAEPPPAAGPIEAEITAATPVTAAPPATGAATPAAIVESAPAPAATSTSEPDKPEPTGAEPNKPVPPRNRAGEPTKQAGQVAVFVSKREKKIFVRQGFVPIFEMPVEIADPSQPLGTHVFTAMEVRDEGARMRWNAITMPPESPRAAEGKGKKKAGKKPAPAPTPGESRAPSSAAQALDRITMPQEAIDRISELLIPGSSLIISDHGLGPETGRYTEFIVLTR